MSSQELRNTLAENPTDWEVRQALVETLVAEGLHESAVEVINEGDAIPREPGPWLAAAKCYAAVGAGEQARSLVATALEIDPEHAASIEYQRELSIALAPKPVSLSGEDVEEEAEIEIPAITATPVPDFAKVAADGDDPIQLPKVSHSHEELEALHEAEQESKRQMEATIKRDKFNSIGITVILHVVIIAALMLVATKIPPNVPPQIVASTAPPSEEETIDDTKLEKPTLEPTTAVNSAVADIISVAAVSDVSISNIDVAISDVAMEQSVMFNPSMSIGMPTSSESKMMFGEPVEGKVLGVILDVSGSMAEYLPTVIREVDKNFENAPILYVRNMVIRTDKRKDEEIIPVIAEEVLRRNKEFNTGTPYSFLWDDLPRKAPQRYVDKLIEMFKTRPNQFIADSQHWDQSNTNEAIDFLMEQDIDSLYIFSDFADFVDEDLALELGQKLGRRKVRTYLQPAEKGTEHLDTMTSKIANRTLGRQMPSLVSILRGGGDKDDPLDLTKKEEKDTTEMDLADLGVQIARPRDEAVSDEFYASRPSKNWFEIHRISNPAYDAVFYGPQAKVFIYIKDSNGKYIQNPIQFGYRSRKEIPDHPDPRHRIRERKFLRLEEDPSFDGKEIVWKMILEDDLEFRVHLYLDSRGMNATYVADPPKDGTYDHPYIYFRFPELAREKEDRYFGFDPPKEGLKLDDIRKMAQPNTVTLDLPKQLRDQYGKQWIERGFEPGYNTRHFDDLIRHYPSGIRDMLVKGPAFGERVFHARTVTNNVLLGASAWRADTEPWESFSAYLRRPEDRRTGFRKSEAISIEIE